jgi:hypothetical protein
MIKLKKMIHEQQPVQQQQQVQPSQQNQFEPEKVQKPVVKPQMQRPVKKQVPVKSPAAKPVQTGDVNAQKIQQQIFSIKMRLNQLSLNTGFKKFQTSLRSFDNKVTRNITDKNVVQQYLAPLLGDLQSIQGSLQSLEAELKKLDGMTKVEEQP